MPKAKLTPSQEAILNELVREEEGIPSYLMMLQNAAQMLGIAAPYLEASAQVVRDRGVHVYPHMIRPGDTILEEYEDQTFKKRTRKIQVLTVVPYACSSYGTHVNGQACYDRSVKVRIKRF